MDAPWALASPSMTWHGRKSTRPKNQTNEVQILAFPHISSMTSSPGSCLSLSFLVIKWKGYRECEWWLVGVYGPEENGTQPIIFETLLVSTLREFSLRGGPTCFLVKYPLYSVTEESTEVRIQ